jgi:hypothetical protein
MYLNSISGQPSQLSLMMETEVVFEMLGFYPYLTWLVAQEEYMEFSHHEIFKY